jgi:hypothetical protein
MSESIQTTKNKLRMYEGWNDSVYKWIDSSEPRMKNDTIHPSDESIQCKVIEFYETIQIETSRFKCESIQKVVNRFICSQRLKWVDSVYDESIHYAKRWTMTLFHKTQDET